MQIKRITALLLAAVLSLSLASCGNSNTDTDVPNREETQAGGSQTMGGLAFAHDKNIMEWLFGEY